jgi:hypothetical protein
VRFQLPALLLPDRGSPPRGRRARAWIRQRTVNPVERFGDSVKNAICDRLFAGLRPLEDAILAELEPLRQSGHRVAQLIGHGWLPEQANAGAPH